jgi:hypothetical protein
MKRTLVLCLFTGLLLLPAPGGRTRGQAKQSKPHAAAVELPLDHGGKIESKYDGFAHETIVALRKMGITCAEVRGGGAKGVFKGVCVSLAVSLHCPGKQLDHVRHVKLQLSFEAKDWDARHPLGERDLSVVADGETIRLGTMQLADTGVGGGWLDEKMKEVFEVSLPHKTFERLAQAQYVEMSIGKTAFALREKNIAALRDLNNRVRFAKR